MKKILVIGNTILLFIVMIFLINKEEMYLKNDSFYLEILPVDPRSLLQGDYMILDYVVTEKAKKMIVKYNDKEYNKGYITVQLENNKIGKFRKISKIYPKLNKKEFAIKYTYNSEIINIGANSYLFQEGKRKIFEDARYVEVVDTGKGKIRIKNLLNDKFEIIK